MANNIPTPHIGAGEGEIAPFVLMPGDPLRAEVVAETFLRNPVKYNNIRGMYGFTGEFNGKRVSVQGSGMGMPSMGIYSYELYNFYGVERIVRIGSAGALHDGLELGDIVLGMGASTNSSYTAQYGLGGSLAPVASFDLLQRAAAAAKELGLRCQVGGILSSDTFYDDDPEFLTRWKRLGVLAVEMEAAALYANAARAGKEALCVLTISDCPLRGLSLPAEARQNSFTDMMKVALALA